MSSSLLIRWVAGLFILVSAGSVFAETYELLDGQVITGPPLSITKDGVAFRDASGNQGTRVGYTNLTQQALQELQKNPKAKKFLEPFLEIPLENTNKNRAAFELKPFERLQRPDPQGGLSRLFGSSLGLLLVAILFGANLYSGYEIGIFRNYSPLMVAAIALVLPLVTQIVFLCLPTYVPKAADLPVDATGAHVPTFTSAGGGHGVGATQAAVQEAAAADAAAAAAALPHYKRGEFTFNKRFFETKMGGFYGSRPIEAEKGFVFDVKSSKGLLHCNRIVRISNTDIYLQVLRGTTIEEVTLPFTDIVEIEIKQRGH